MADGVLVDLAGHRNVVVRDPDGRVARHFVVLPFAARWLAGEFAPSEELAEAQWALPDDVVGLKTTDGLAEVIANAARLVLQDENCDAMPAPRSQP